MKGRRVKQVFSRGRYQREGEDIRKRRNEDEYGQSILYSHIKIEK
jgi:hypothetical protein